MSWQFFNFFGHDGEDMQNTIIIDSGASTHLFSNPDWLDKITESDKKEDLQTNGGPVIVHQQGALPDFGVVPHHRDALTNIVSLAPLTDTHRVAFDSAQENVFLVHTPRGIVRFARNASDLHTKALARPTASLPSSMPLCRHWKRTCPSTRQEKSLELRKLVNCSPSLDFQACLT